MPRGWYLVLFVLGGSIGPVSSVEAARLSDLARPPVVARALRSGLEVAAVPMEDQLSAGATGFLRTVRKRFRQTGQVFRRALASWRSWSVNAVAMVLLIVLVPVLDRGIVSRWREHGLGAFGRALTSAVAVYTRLLRDGRAPLLGKGLLAFTLVYGIADQDLMPDHLGWVFGFSDDIVLILLASRSFMKMCPDALVLEHARRVARVGEAQA